MVAHLASRTLLKSLSRLLAVAMLGAATWAAQAGPLPLQGRDINGNPVAANDASAVFEYDPNLDITWLRDWNVNGKQDWYNQVAWAAGLSVGGYSGWRLPFIIDTGSPGCNYSKGGGTDCGFNVQTKSGTTVYSEMAYMWYEELGNLSPCPPTVTPTPGVNECMDSPQPGWGLTNTGPFLNMVNDDYFAGQTYALNSDDTWYFSPSNGSQTNAGKCCALYAVAVRDGDVAAAVSEPVSLALLALGLAGLRFSRRKKA